MPTRTLLAAAKREMRGIGGRLWGWHQGMHARQCSCTWEPSPCSPGTVTPSLRVACPGQQPGPGSRHGPIPAPPGSWRGAQGRGHSPFIFRLGNAMRSGYRESLGGRAGCSELKSFFFFFSPPKKQSNSNACGLKIHPSLPRALPAPPSLG